MPKNARRQANKQSSGSRNGGLKRQVQGEWSDLNQNPLDLAFLGAPAGDAANFTLDDGTASLDLAFEVADYFKLSPKRARGIAGEVGKVVARWEQEAAGLGIGKTEREHMGSAFNHDNLRQVARMRSS